MKLIVGLGNPGEKYAGSRHNLGFMVADTLLATLMPVEKTNWQLDKKAKAEVAKLQDLVLAKPQTLMNNSGWSVQTLANFYKIKPQDIWVVHDDLDLPLGKIKIRLGGGTAGHHGLESVAQRLGTFDFVRFRLGIGKPQGHDEWEKIHVARQKIEDYVLDEFRSVEKKEVKRMMTKAVEALKVALEEDLERAMNRFNLK